MLFLDGVGLGRDDPAVNPFARAATPALDALAGGRWVEGLADRTEPGRTVRSLDATLGHPSLPQSATGQTTLLTGIDGVAAMGRPYGPWPGPTLVKLLETDSLFHDAAAGGAVLANAYAAGYLDALANPTGARRRMRPSAALVAARGAGLAVRGDDDLRHGRAVAADLGFATADPRAASTVAAARPLAALAAANVFTYLDVWITDRTGHRADVALSTRLVERLDAFVGALVPALRSTTLVVVSDHGNLEDAASTRHTRAPVPLIALGPAAPAFAAARDLRDVAPAVRRAWTGNAARSR